MKKILALVAVAATFVLTGCSQVGAAATVGDTKITQATVQGSIDSILAERAKVDTTQMQLETGETLNRSQLRFHLLSTLLREVGNELKITVSKAEIDTRRASILDQVGGAASLPTALVNAGIAPDDLDTYIEAISYSDKIGQKLVAAGVTEDQVGTELQKLVVAKAKELGVTVNPRYGKWDATVADVVATDSASPAVTPATK
ncbi:MAG: SurA N-terminal domain-containing protein [Acidobacteriota bacterium]|nr:SurA N-terminal domain-containing protein [Acidobacteriota bacterium]